MPRKQSQQRLLRSTWAKQQKWFLGIHLTQLGTICSICGRGELPPNVDGTGAAFLVRCSVSAVFAFVALAGRLCLSTMSVPTVLAYEERVVSVPRLSTPSIGDSGNDLSRQSVAVDNMVSGHLVCDEPEKRSECAWVETYSGFWELPDGLGLVAQVSTGDGATRTGSADGQD